MTDESNDRRRERLQAMADECQSVYDDRTAEALETGGVPRYALLTAESGHEDNPNLTVHETVAGMIEAASSEANEQYVWSPEQMIDLGTGEAIRWRVRVELDEPAPDPMVVYAVNLPERIDGLYLFADADDARAFALVAGAHGADVVETDEPVASREGAAQLIAAERDAGEEAV